MVFESEELEVLELEELPESLELLEPDDELSEPDDELSEDEPELDPLVTEPERLSVR